MAAPAVTEHRSSEEAARPASTIGSGRSTVEPAHAHLAVLGSPISHSRSPRIHRAAYEVLGLSWEYEAIECDRSGLRPLLESRGTEWRGFSVTMPLKGEAHRASRILDPVAEESGVVNTLLRLDGGAGWAGFNTDVPGLAAAIREAGFDAARTVVLGSGATAVSALLAARSLGAESIEIAARNVEAVSELVARWPSVSGTNLAFPEAVGLSPVGERPTLVISTLPGRAAETISLPGWLSEVPLFDVAYDPWPSPLAARWEANGGRVHAGLGMLLHQALAQVRVFVNGDPTFPLADEAQVFAAMRRAV